MPADIRSFFGNGRAKAQDQNLAKTDKKTKPVPAKRQKARKVVSDSEDEASPVEVKAPKPKIPKSEKAAPKVEEIDASSYFASTSKAKKSTKSTPTKVKQERSEMATPQAPLSLPERTSARKRKTTAAAPKYSLQENSDVSGDDIFQDGVKTGRHMDDEYEESDSDVAEVEAKPAAKRAKRESTEDSRGQKDTSVSKKQKDLPKPSINIKSSTSTAKGRKRKSPAESEVDSLLSDEQPKKRANKNKSPAKKTASKKTSSAKGPVSESKAIQQIYDNVPTIRAPTPPPQDPNNKPKFRPGGAHPNSGPAPGAGSVEIPDGAENCLAGLSFVFTGMLMNLDREVGQSLVKKYGGRVVGTISSKTDFVVLGSEAGPSKLVTIQKLNTKTIDEDGLFYLIRSLPPNGGDSNAAAAYEAKKAKDDEKIKKMVAEMDREEDNKRKSQPTQSQSTASSQLMTVKYAPSSLGQICGNKTQVERLSKWLRAFPTNLRKDFKHLGADGSGKYRAVMIHGPAGIGKTTAAHVVAKIEGYDVIEMNASDTRSKKLVETGLRDVLDNTSLIGFYAGLQKKIDDKKKKIVLIMDEVDGMSAGDRGGVGALAQICRKTSIPIILICNERRQPKMKPFDFVAYELPFRRPTTVEIRSRILTLCHREGMKMSPPVVDALIEGCHADIRQIINMISTIKVDSKNLNFEDSKSMTKAWEKHAILKPWDIVSTILSGHMFQPTSKAKLGDKIELYFNDHSLSFLMLQENYLKTSPTQLGKYSGRERNLKHLELIEKASESISDGDLIDQMIHGSQQQWSLMPNHAVASFVRPAFYTAGSLARAGNEGGFGKMGFTSWLGNNSKQTKLYRLVKEIQGHMRLRASGDRHEIRQQYLPLLWYKLVAALQTRGKECVPEVIDLMDSYFLTREDWDSIMELGVGSMDQEKVKIDTQTKATFTRLYNSQSHSMPFMKASNVITPSRSTKEKPDLEEAIEESDDGEDPAAEKDAPDEDGDISKDKFIKQPKKKAAKATKASKKK